MSKNMSNDKVSYESLRDALIGLQELKIIDRTPTPGKTIDELFPWLKKDSSNRNGEK